MGNVVREVNEIKSYTRDSHERNKQRHVDLMNKLEAYNSIHAAEREALRQTIWGMNPITRAAARAPSVATVVAR
jgi:hypothetical protein